jgi:uncharacterized membrane protein
MTHLTAKLRWLFILIFFLITIVGAFFYEGIMKDIIPIVSILSLFIAVCLHGYERYGLKNIFIFFMITWVVSHFFEALSIQVGFPFGHYQYVNLVGPRLFEVPLIIMLAYFGTGYASWILSNVLLDQYSKTLSSYKIVIVPLIGTFIMVMWDVCMDPISSTIGSLWVWRDGGVYFGVPIQNYFGWFLVVYIIFQLFALYISKFDRLVTNNRVLSSKTFWLEAVALYGIQALSQLLNPFTQTDHMEIYSSMAMLTVFTMIFVALLSYIKIRESKELV